MAKNISKKTQAAGEQTTDAVVSSHAATKFSKKNSTIRDESDDRKRNIAQDDTQYQIELERSIQHICNLTLENRLCIASISHLRRVLDVGSGCGFWAIDMAKASPTTEIRAFDLLPAPSGPHPKNLVFCTHDCCENWPYPEEHFDLIHIRGLFGSIRDWPALYRKALKHLQRGGFIEHVEWSMHVRSTDGKLSSNSVFSQWSQNIVNAGMTTGKTFEIAENMAGLIGEAGFVGVVEKGFRWPIGPWSDDAKMQEIGRLNLVNWARALETWSLSISAETSSTMTRAELEQWIARSQDALRNPGHEIYHEMRVVYARKP